MELFSVLASICAIIDCAVKAFRFVKSKISRK